MWITEAVAASATMVMACVEVMRWLDERKAKMESGNSRPSTRQANANEASSAEQPATRAARRRSNVGLFCVFIGLGNLAWLQFGPAASAPLSTGNAASIAVSLSLLGFAVMVSRS